LYTAFTIQIFYQLHVRSSLHNSHPPAFTFTCAHENILAQKITDRLWPLITLKFWRGELAEPASLGELAEPASLGELAEPASLGKLAAGGIEEKTETNERSSRIVH
jgi:hypothetical protein